MTLQFSRSVVVRFLGFALLLTSVLSASGQLATLRSTKAPVRNLRPGTISSASRAQHPRPMRSTPVQDLMQRMAQRRAAAQATSGLPVRSLANDEPAPGPNFTGFVSAPYAADRTSTNTLPNATAVTADFNGDGKPDLATVQNDGTINILLSPATGTFASTGLTHSVIVGANTEVSWLQAADLNGDGKPDLIALATSLGGDIGGFSRPRNSSIRPRPAYLDDPGSYVLIYLNDGSGNFAAPLVTPLQNTPYGSDASVWNVALGDVNGDGSKDLVVLSNEMIFTYGDDGSVTTQDLTIEQSYLNDGAGNLIIPTTEYDYSYSDFLQPAILQAQLVDMNHDGKLDLITVLAPNGAQRFITVQVQLGNGDGTFAPFSADALTNPTSVIQTYNGIGNLSVADVNNDGYPDVVLVSDDLQFPGQVLVALNQGDGTLGPLNPVVQGVDVALLMSANLADLNGDGNLDLIVYSWNSVAIYAGKGDGTFSAAPASQYVTGFSSTVHPAPADFDGDGKLDIADVDSDQNKAAVFLGKGDLTFAAAPALAVTGENASNFQAVASGQVVTAGTDAIVGQDWAHLNADYYPDLFTASPDGHGGLHYVKALSADALDAAAVQFVQPITADLNGDGVNDLLLASAGGISVAYSQKDGTFAAPVALNLGEQVSCSISFVDAADINGDGRIDLSIAYQGDAYCGSGGSIPSGYFILLNNGDGTFASTFVPMGTYLYQTKLIDLDGDGKLDLVAADNDPISLHFSVTAIPGKGDGTFDSSRAAVVLTTYQVDAILAGDYNADGKQDLTFLTGGQVDGDGNPIPGYPGVALLAGHGDFTFDAPTFTDVGHVATWGAYTDLNGDGYPDLALADADSTTGEPVANLVTVINNGNGTFGATQEPYIAKLSNLGIETYTSYAFAVDLNLDGSPDLVSTGSFNSGLFINAGGVKLTLTADPTTPIAGAEVTLTATVSSTVNPAAPGGTITFLSDGVSLGSAPISGGTATLSTTALTVGGHTLEARYSGDALHNQAKSDIQISVAPAPDFTLTAGSSSLTIKDGTSGTVTLSLAANASFSGSIQVTCGGSIEGISCTASPASVSVTNSQTGSVTVTIAAQNATAAVRHAETAMLTGAVSLTLALLIFVPRRGTRGFWVALVCLALGGSALGVIGCGGGKKHAPVTGTVTITATSGGITKTQTVSVTVTPN